MVDPTHPLKGGGRKEVIRAGQLQVDKVYRGTHMSTHGHTSTEISHILTGANIAPALSTLSLAKQCAVFETDSKKYGDLLLAFPSLLEPKLIHELRRPL